MRFGSFATAFAKSSGLGGASFQPFALATSWRVFKTAATPPAALTIARTSSTVRFAFL